MLRCAIIDDFESNRATSPIFARVQEHTWIFSSTPRLFDSSTPRLIAWMIISLEWPDSHFLFPISPFPVKRAGLFTTELVSWGMSSIIRGFQEV